MLVEQQLVLLVLPVNTTVQLDKLIVKVAVLVNTMIYLELGGNDAAIIMPGTDSSKIASKLFDGAFGNSGQVCAAIKRVYVHEDDHDALVAALSPNNNLKLLPNIITLVFSM